MTRSAFIADGDLIQLVARALIALENETTSHPDAVYPPDVQQALDQVGLACLLHRRSIPKTVPALVEWCALTPLSEWPLAEPSGDGRFLLDAGTRRPTRYCLDLAGSAAAEDHDSIRAVLTDLRERCGSAERFQACRRLLITSPVLARDSAVRLMADPAAFALWSLVRDLYQRAPAAGAVCPGCGEPVSGSCDTWWCEGPAAVPAADVQVLPRELRRCVVHPGLGERRIERWLRELGVSVAAAPALLGGLSLPDLGWTVHTTVRTDPMFVVADLPEPALTQQVVVIPPTGQATDRLDSGLRTLMPGVDVRVLTEQDFLDEVETTHHGAPDA